MPAHAPVRAVARWPRPGWCADHTPASNLRSSRSNLRSSRSSSSPRTIVCSTSSTLKTPPDSCQSSCEDACAWMHARLGLGLGLGLAAARAPARMHVQHEQRHPEVFRWRRNDDEMVVRNGGHRNGDQIVMRGHQRSSRTWMMLVIRGHQRSSEAIRGHQRPSEVIRVHHAPRRQSEVISEVIRGHHAPG